MIAKVAKPPKYAAIKRIALTLPGAHEELTRHGIWFNVGKKTFALYWGKDARWIFKLPHDRQEFLFEVRPEIFAPMKAGRLLWSYVRVEDLDTRELKDLLIAAWSMVVPKRLLSATKIPEPSSRPSRDRKPRRT